jgi:hypothetical protein
MLSYSGLIACSLFGGRMELLKLIWAGPFMSGFYVI